MPTDIMAFRRATYIWPESDILLLHDTWVYTREDLSKITTIKSKEFIRCLERGNEVIMEKMIDLILSPTYIKPSDVSGYSLNWKDAPHFMAKFLQQLETVFVGDKEIKIRHKIRHDAGNQTAAESADDQEAKHWNGADIETLSHECESAMKSLENDPAIMSSEYKQCLQKGRNIIINTMKKFIMDTENFPKHSSSSQYILRWESAPKALATILHHSETVFTGTELEFHIGKKEIMFPKNRDLVHLVREPDPRQKCGILKTYGKIKSFSANDKFHLKVLQGKRIWDEEWVEEGETHNLSEEANAMLCMHLWSLRKYAGDESYENISNEIKNGWPECVSWETGPAGKFWKIIVPDQLPSWVVDGYEDMEKYFKIANTRV